MSHASFFTGRWPHELDIKWQTPLRKSFPMLAEYLAEKGYATAGLVSNATYCSYDTGLDRGFAHYEDYLLDNVNILRTAVIVDEIRKMAIFLVFLGLRHDAALLQTVRTLEEFHGDRIELGVSLGYRPEEYTGVGLSSPSLSGEFAVYSGHGYTTVPDAWGLSQGVPLS